MNDGIRLVSELSGNTYTNSCGCEIAIIKIANDVVMTSKEMARMFGVSVPTISKKLKKLFSTGELNKKQVGGNLLVEPVCKRQNLRCLWQQFQKLDQKITLARQFSGEISDLVSVYKTARTYFTTK
jgi:CTP-dependent riboflavin kinase